MVLIDTSISADQDVVFETSFVVCGNKMIDSVIQALHSARDIRATLLHSLTGDCFGGLHKSHLTAIEMNAQ